MILRSNERCHTPSKPQDIPCNPPEAPLNTGSRLDTALCEQVASRSISLYIYIHIYIYIYIGFPIGTSGKEPPASFGYIRDVGSIPGLGRSSGGGHGNALQYSCLENPMDRGTWQAIVHRVAESWTSLKQLSVCVCVYILYIHIYNIYMFFLIFLHQVLVAL